MSDESLAFLIWIFIGIDVALYVAWELLEVKPR